MITRRRWHFSALAVAALIVAGCGGGTTDSPIASRVVSFGDSLSDLGTHVALTSVAGPGGPAPYFAGRYTTNTHTGYTATSNTNTATIWIEWIAARVGVPITQAMAGAITPAGAIRVPCPAAANPALAQSCTAYGQGGARVSQTPGWGSPPQLADPLTTQVAAHLARFTKFNDTDIVFAWTGGNDFLIQSRDLGLNLITPTTAVTNMATAGTDLANLIKTQIVANGATRVVAMTLPDPGITPDYAALAASDPATKDFLTQMTTAYNSALIAGLAGTNVQIIDVGAYLADVVARPAAYGFVNSSQGACDPAKIPPAAGGSALFCNAASAALFTAAGLPNLNMLRAGANVNTWVFADGVHPSTGGHKAIADYVWGKLKDFGWVPSNL
jgi:phospholipase/lecithinase/hemolysin